MVHNSTGPTPSLVGKSFVKRYYTLLNNDPLSLHRFYNDHSIVTHGEQISVPERDIPVFGIEHIKERLKEHCFDDCRVKLSFVDCQKSVEGGILLQVHGQMINRERKPRRFTQTFFLAVQKDGFYVHNDILRFLDPLEELNESVAASLQDEPVMDDGTASPVHSTSAIHESIDSHVESTPVHEVLHEHIPEANATADVETFTAPPVHFDSDSNSHSHSHRTNEKPAAIDSVSSSSRSFSKGTWASRVASVSAPTVATPSATQVTTPAPAISNSTNVTPDAESDDSDAKDHHEKPVDSSGRPHARQTHARDNRSLYVGGLPTGTDLEALKKQFEKFGEVLNVSTPHGKTCAFVTFSTEEATQAALSFNKFTYQDKSLSVRPREIRQGIRRGRFESNTQLPPSQQTQASQGAQQTAQDRQSSQSRRGRGRGSGRGRGRGRFGPHTDTHGPSAIASNSVKQES